MTLGCHSWIVTSGNYLTAAMLETIRVDMSMNDKATRVEQPCIIRLCFDDDGTACVRIMKENGDLIEIPVFKSIGFAKEVMI